MAEKNGDIEKEMKKKCEVLEQDFTFERYLSHRNLPPHMKNEGEIHWYIKKGDEFIFLSAHREIITDQSKINKFLDWQIDCQERLSKLRNGTVQQLCEIKGLPYR